MKRTIFLILFILGVSIARVHAQENEKIPVYETFRTYYLVNGHSVESLYSRDLFLNISHRFGGYLSDGAKDFFGMDLPSNIRLELMYGLTEDLDIGLARNSFRKIYDGTVKYRILQQMEGGFPLTITLLGSAAVMTDDWSAAEAEVLSFKHRLSYLTQLLMARKIGEFLSLQVSPAYVHRNLVGEIAERNRLFSLGLGASLKITHSLALKAEYNHRFSEGELQQKNLHQVFGLSFDITNERHSYQIHVSNNTGLIGQEFIPSTRDDFFGGDLHLGFRITRKFGL